MKRIIKIEDYKNIVLKLYFGKLTEMSGTIRQSMTHTVTRLRIYIDEICPILDAQERTDEGIEILRTTLVKIRRLITRSEDKASQW